MQHNLLTYSLKKFEHDGVYVTERQCLQLFAYEIRLAHEFNLLFVEYMTVVGISLSDDADVSQDAPLLSLLFAFKSGRGKMLLTEHLVFLFVLLSLSRPRCLRKDMCACYSWYVRPSRPGGNGQEFSQNGSDAIMCYIQRHEISHRISFFFAICFGAIHLMRKTAWKSEQNK